MVKINNFFCWRYITPIATRECATEITPHNNNNKKYIKCLSTKSVSIILDIKSETRRRLCKSEAGCQKQLSEHRIRSRSFGVFVFCCRQCTSARRAWCYGLSTKTAVGCIASCVFHEVYTRFGTVDPASSARAMCALFVIGPGTFNGT